MEKHRRECPFCHRFVEIREHDSILGGTMWAFVVHYEKHSRKICPTSSCTTNAPMVKRFEFA